MIVTPGIQYAQERLFYFSRYHTLNNNNNNRSRVGYERPLYVFMCFRSEKSIVIEKKTRLIINKLVEKTQKILFMKCVFFLKKTKTKTRF